MIFYALYHEFICICSCLLDNIPVDLSLFFALSLTLASKMDYWLQYKCAQGVNTNKFFSMVLWKLSSPSDGHVKNELVSLLLIFFSVLFVVHFNTFTYETNNSRMSPISISPLFHLILTNHRPSSAFRCCLFPDRDKARVLIGKHGGN